MYPQNTWASNPTPTTQSGGDAPEPELMELDVPEDIPDLMPGHTKC